MAIVEDKALKGLKARVEYELLRLEGDYAAGVYTNEEDFGSVKDRVTNLEAAKKLLSCVDTMTIGTYQMVKSLL